MSCAVVLGRRAEVDVAAHPARAHERGVQRVERDVRGADEVDLLAARLGRAHPQADAAQALRHDVERVEERVERAWPRTCAGRAARRRRPSAPGAGSAPARRPCRPSSRRGSSPRGGGRRPRARWAGRRAAGGSARAAKRRSRQARVSSTRSPEGFRAPQGPYIGGASSAGRTGSRPVMLPPPAPSAWRRRPTASISSMKTMHVPPHLRARRRALRMRNMTMITSMPMKVWAKPEPGIVTIGALKFVAIALDSIVLPGARRADEEQAALGLAAGLAEVVARRPELDDLRDLGLRLLLAADVAELHAPVGVARLVALHLAQPEEQQRAEEDEEVDEEEQRELEPVEER